MKTFLKFITIISIFVLASCSNVTNRNEHRINAVPKSAFMIIEAEEMGNAFGELNENSLWQVIEKYKGVNLISEQLNSLNDFLKKNKISIDDEKFLLSIHKTGKKSLDYLVYLYEDEIDFNSISDLRKYKVSTKQYDDIDIDKFSFPGVSSPIYVSKYDGILLFSKSIILVENSVRQLESGISLMDNENFNSLYNSLNTKEDFNLLIDISKLDLLNSWATQKDFVSWTSKFSGWMELDVSPDENEVFLSGITTTNDSIGHYLGVFKDLNASKITIDELLPSSTSFAVSYGIESFPKYYRSYSEYLRNHGKFQRFNAAQKLYKIHRRDLFDSWIDNQFSLVSVAADKANLNYNDLVLIKSKDEALAIDALSKVSDKTVTKFRSYDIRRFNKKDVLKSYLGQGFDKIHKPYYAIINDVVVFSDDLKIVKDVISDYLDGRSLSNYKHFKNIKSDLSSKSNILFYFKNPDFAETLVGVFPNLKDVITNNIKDLSKYRSGAIQFSYDNDIAFTNILLKESVEEESEVKPLWELDFDAELYEEISTLYNHKTKEKEIAVQDKNNVLYLISNSGKILWKKKLDSKILGSIKQVDLYKNKKLQMVFNTEKYLYLIDRNGNKVASYPKKLRWKATAGVGVFDYSKIRDYRLLVPMGSHLIMYDGRGNVVKGFVAKGISGTVDKAPQHFRVKGKDYLVVSTSSGNIYVLDRRGNQKFNISQKYVLGRNNFYVSEGKTLKESSFVTLTKDGKLLKVFLNGVVKVEDVDGFDKNTYYEVDGSETISLSNNELRWSDGKTDRETDVEGGNFCKPQLFKIGKTSNIMFGSKAINKIFLFNTDLDLQKGFPIYGQIVGEPTDYNNNEAIDFPVIVNQGKGNLKMYSVN